MYLMQVPKIAACDRGALHQVLCRSSAHCFQWIPRGHLVSASPLECS